MHHRDIFVIGASAGGVHALIELAAGLPADLPVAIFVVQHVSPYGRSAMPNILSRSGPLEAVHPEDNDRIHKGRIYVAPPDHHLLIQDGHVRLSRAPTENGHRPAVDVLFRSAARAYGARVVGVILTGSLDDGTAGLTEIKRYGGLAVVQSPEEADYPGMPRSAIENVDVDHVASLSALSELLVGLSREPLPEEQDPPVDEEAMAMKEQLERGQDREAEGKPSGFTCPECGGALWESPEDGLVHFRCRTGHAFSPESLLAQQDEGLEYTLWAAVRALQESADLARRMERWMANRGAGAVAGRDRYHRRAEEATRHAEVLRKMLVHEKAEVEVG